MGFFDSFNDALEGREHGPFEIEGHTVTCSHCGGTAFERSDAQLNTAGLTFLGLDWANRSATIFICLECGHIEWFLE